MTNIVTSVVARIEARLTETKNACKTYKTEEAADKVGAKYAKIVADHHMCKQPAKYVVIYVPSIQRFTPAFDLNELIRRPESTGGYIGLLAQHGFFTF